MNEWIEKPLSEIADITMGQSPDSKYYTEEEQGMPFIQGCAEFSARNPKPKISCTQIKKVAKAGSILFSVRAPVGRINVADRDYVIGRGLASILAKDIDPDLLEKCLVFREPQFRAASQGSTFEAINSKELSHWPIRFPIKPFEQATIAEVLSTLDGAIEQTEALIAKQQRIKTGLMQDLLARGVDEHGNIRSEATHAFKDSPLGRIPVEWDALPLSKLVDEPITYGIVQAGPHQEGGVPYIRTGDMSGEKIDRAQLLCTTPTIAKAYKRSEVQVGDIVFALRATVGKVLPITADLAGANLTQGTAKISPSDDVDSGFLLWALRTEAVLRSIQLVQKGTTFAEITLSDLRLIKIAIPRSLEEQQQVAKDLNACFDLLHRYSEQSYKLQSLKRGLMHDLLTGERRVTELLAQAAPQ